MNRMHMSEKSLQEVHEITKHIPRQGTPVEERRSMNAKVRELLASTSNDAVIDLALRNQRHNLSLKELRKRCFERKFTLSEIFRLLARKGCIPKDLWEWGLEEVVRLGKEAEPDEIIELAQDWAGSEISDDLAVITGAISHRNDRDMLCEIIPKNQRPTWDEMWKQK